MDFLLRNKKYIFLGLFPALALFIFFVVYPIVRSFFYGFYDWNGLSAPIYVGLANFKAVLSDKVFWHAFRNNIFIVIISVFGQIPLGLALAVLLNGKFKGAKFFRFIFFMPMILSTVVVGLLWSTILNSQVGIINSLLKNIGLSSLEHNWLGEPGLALYSIGFVIIWQFFGLYMIILMAALQNIPKEVFESAELDGASGLAKLFGITLPMIWGSITACVVLCIAGGMKTFDLVFTMTQGGPAHATDLMAIYMYNKTFEIYKYGYGSAVSLVIFVLSFVLIIGSRLLMTRKSADL
ncbi:MAG: sugar ABC transporter permease [Spirochaetes bacterium]|nr:sugar ABC transporter permease [Spirochaetota bacterium]